MPLLDSDISVAKNMFDLNVFAVIEVTKAFMPLLIASKGTVINIGSMLGNFPFVWQGYYNASKAALNLLSDQLRLELSVFDVKVINIVSGTVATNFFKNLPGQPHIPSNSLYWPAKEDVESLMDGKRAKSGAAPVEEYAEAVVNNALKSNPKKAPWIGGEVFPIWAAYTFGWHTIWDSILPGLLGARFPSIKKRLQEAAASQ